MKRVMLSVSLLALLTTVNCYDDAWWWGADDGGLVEPAPPKPALTATIDNQTFVATAGSISVTDPAIRPVVISGSSESGRVLKLTLWQITTEGTYPLGVDPATARGGTGSVILTRYGITREYVTPPNGNAGSVTITTRTDRRIKGTFHFKAIATTGSPQSTTISKGTFEITI